MILALTVSVLCAIQLPATPAGQQLDAWLQAVASGDEARLQALHAGEPQAARNVAQDRNLAQRTGGLEVVRIERATDTEIEVTARARATQTYLRLIFGVEPAPPHRIASIGLRPTAAPDDGKPRPKLADADVGQKLEGFVSGLAAGGRFSGAVLLVHDGKPVFEKAYGLASRAWNAPNKLDTRFNLGSMNKMFTAVAVLQLVTEGKLGLDDKVGKLLPDFAGAEVRDQVTVRQLLTHTSGLGNYMSSPRFQEKKLELREVRDYLPILAEEKLAFAPGARFSYSNSGFMLLGAIVEKVSGQGYHDYIREHVTGPAGMKDTDCYEVDRDLPNLALGYTRDEAGGVRSNILMHVARGGPAGGGYSTVRDLARFAAALREGKLLPPARVAELTTGKVDAPMGKYAFGFGEESIRGHRLFGHNGGFPGVSANLDIFPDDGWVIVVLSNIDQGAMPVVQQARELVAR